MVYSNTTSISNQKPFLRYLRAFHPKTCLGPTHPVLAMGVVPMPPYVGQLSPHDQQRMEDRGREFGAACPEDRFQKMCCK